MSWIGLIEIGTVLALALGFGFYELASLRAHRKREERRADPIPKDGPDATSP